MSHLSESALQGARHLPWRGIGVHDIVEAARRLLLDRGYAQVTVAGIAQEAGTAVKTVYAGAGGRAEILREIVGAGVAGSGAEETLRRVRACPDGASALAELAGARAGATRGTGRR